MTERQGETASEREDWRDASPEEAVVTSGSVHITSEHDILQARQTTREVAERMEFRLTDVTRLVTAVSELARNIHLYADEGVMYWAEIRHAQRTGLELVFEDNGPGIENVEAALQGNYSTSNGMGRGLRGTRKLVDEFDIETDSSGTTITIRKWIT